MPWRRVAHEWWSNSVVFSGRTEQRIHQNQLLHHSCVGLVQQQRRLRERPTADLEHAFEAAAPQSRVLVEESHCRGEGRGV